MGKYINVTNKKGIKVSHCLAELKREKAAREIVYPSLKRKGKITEKQIFERELIIDSLIDLLSKYDKNLFISKIKSNENSQNSLF